MKDFGFMVRMIAIGWLFALVLGNYGGHWLSPDNPIVASQRAASPPKSLRQIAAEARPRTVVSAQAGQPRQSARQRAVAGWGGEGADQPARDEGADPSFGAADQLDDSEWANAAGRSPSD